MKTVSVGSVKFSNVLPFSLISGNCALESKDHSFLVCDALKKACDKLGIGFVYKSSFDKANRTSLSSKRGVGMDEGLKILEAVKKEFGVPVVTDVHEISQVEAVGKIVDIVQIPALLSRQTDLLIAAGKTGKTVNVKKGQFIAPWDIGRAADKISKSTGNDNVLLTDRGTSFGYNGIVVDMTGLAVMAETGYPVIMDATHGIQMPSAGCGVSSGNREHAKLIARSAIAAGVAGIFIETHEDPDNAPCDGPNSIKLSDMAALLAQLKEIDTIIKEKKA